MKVLKIFILLIFVFAPAVKANYLNVKDTIADKIILKNGDTIYCKILEISEKKIIYINKSQNEIKKVKVDKIIYSDGKTELISGRLSKKLAYMLIFLSFLIPPFSILATLVGIIKFDYKKSLLETDNFWALILIITGLTVFFTSLIIFNILLKLKI